MGYPLTPIPYCELNCATSTNKGILLTGNHIWTIFKLGWPSNKWQTNYKGR